MRIEEHTMAKLTFINRKVIQILEVRDKKDKKEVRQSTRNAIVYPFDVLNISSLNG